MAILLFDSLFFISIFLAFTAVTYTPPWNTSNMEFFSFVAGIFLFLSVPFREQKIDLSRSSIFIVCIVFFSVLIYFINRIIFKEQIYLIFLYGIYFVICVSCVLKKDEKFKEYLCTTILLAVLFNCFVIFSQYFSLYNTELGIWMAEYDESHGRPYGNFGQPNLAATFLLTGLCSCIFLYKRNIGFSTLLFVSVFIGSALAFPSSKTSFLCLAVLILLALILRDKKSLIAFAVTAAALWVTKLLLPNTRDMTAVDISTGRFELWMTIVDAISKSPWSGYGLLNTRAAHFSSRELDITPRNQVIGSAHNLFLDFLVWFGVIVGLFLVIYLLYIVFIFLKRNINSSEKIYLVIPIIIHSQLEYPLFYANFLLLFAFLFGMNDVPYKAIESKKFAYSLFVTGGLIFAIVVFDYIRLSSSYTQLRFFNKNFAGVEKPGEINFIALDTTGGQFNFFLKEKISNKDEYEELKNLTKSMPSFKNYLLLINYMNENSIEEEEIKYWMKKAKSSFDGKEVKFLEGILKNKKIIDN